MDWNDFFKFDKVKIAAGLALVAIAFLILYLAEKSCCVGCSDPLNLCLLYSLVTILFFWPSLITIQSLGTASLALSLVWIYILSFLVASVYRNRKKK